MGCCSSGSGQRPAPPTKAPPAVDPVLVTPECHSAQRRSSVQRLQALQQRQLTVSHRETTAADDEVSNSIADFGTQDDDPDPQWLLVSGAGEADGCYYLLPQRLNGSNVWRREQPTRREFHELGLSLSAQDQAAQHTLLLFSDEGSHWRVAKAAALTGEVEPLMQSREVHGGRPPQLVRGWDVPRAAVRCLPEFCVIRGASGAVGGVYQLLVCNLREGLPIWARRPVDVEGRCLPPQFLMSAEGKWQVRPSARLSDGGAALWCSAPHKGQLPHAADLRGLWVGEHQGSASGEISVSVLPEDGAVLHAPLPPAALGHLQQPQLLAPARVAEPEGVATMETRTLDDIDGGAPPSDPQWRTVRIHSSPLPEPASREERKERHGHFWLIPKGCSLRTYAHLRGRQHHPAVAPYTLELGETCDVVFALHQNTPPCLPSCFRRCIVAGSVSRILTHGGSRDAAKDWQSCLDAIPTQQKWFRLYHARLPQGEHTIFFRPGFSYADFQGETNTLVLTCLVRSCAVGEARCEAPPLEIDEDFVMDTGAC
eukprot:TRINITY_DN26047_c0_g1_i1.p1 TRINITY_DN26047_c0_g1~~TRINITY_DN26047_c0_g1_i1.p1  ORF type:complete len:540 (+),score=99.28 TRINITY_DN26047_c0_g1_i1:67-1686(+)